MSNAPVLDRPVYRSSRTFDFQAECMALGYLREDNLAVMSTGIGKTHVAMGAAALLFEDDLIDLVVVACESVKIGEWIADFSFFTTLTAKAYHGDKRRAVLAEMPHVLVSTYETFRNDMAKKRPNTARALDDGVFTSALRGKRVLFVYDEITKLRKRTSGLYRHHEHCLRQLRKHAGHVRSLGLTATPFEKDPESGFNVARLISPGFCTVEQFEKDHVLASDEYGNFIAFVNIGEEDHYDRDVVTLHDKMKPFLIVKDKADDDVRDQFPRQVEEFDFVPVEGVLRELYDEIVKMDEGGTATVLRQILLHPMSLTRSHGSLARTIVGAVGPTALSRMPKPKVDRMLTHLEPIVKGEGRQAVVFSFFGQSVIPLLQAVLEAEGYTVSLNIGSMSRTAKDESKARFRAGETQIFLSSDAGARGINLPEATFVLNFELPTLASIYQQRIDRVHRIDSDAEMVLARSMIAKDTVEEGLAQTVLDRNQWFDTFIEASLAGGGSPYRPTAEERRVLMRLARDQGDES